jgi:polysaccharide biosynthesis transport protein
MNSQRGNPADDGSAQAGGLVPLGQQLPTARDPYSVPAGYGEAAADAPQVFGLNIRDYLRILIKRRWLIVSVVAASAVVGAVTTLMKTPLYTSTVRLQIDPNTAKIVQTGDVTPVEGPYGEFMRTQIELLNGPTIAQRVASALKLGDDQSFFQPRDFSIRQALLRLIGFGSGASGAQRSTEANRETAAAGIVVGNRVVRPVFGSRLVNIDYSDPNPARAQKIAAAYAEAFIASNLDKRFQANSYAKVFLEEQLKTLKLRLEQSQKTLLDFAQKEEIVDTNNKASIAETNLAAANSALDTLVAERIKNETLWRQLDQATAINLPQLLSSSTVETLRSKRNALEADYQDKLETFKPSYPAMMQISNQIAEIDRQLASELKTLKSSYKAAYESSLKQESEMRRRIEALKGDVLDLQKRSIQYNILKREVDTNQTLYDGLLQRYKEVDIAGGVGANNVFIVDKATLPGAPSSPNLSRALIIFIVFGLGAALGIALFLEHLDDTVRSPEDAERISGLVTLGIIPKISSGSTEAELQDPRSHTSEAYRSLCTALQLATENGLPKTLLISSAGPSEGKSTTALTVARHFAKVGLKVLLVDADLRKPTLHAKLGLDNSLGLSNYLTGACEPPEVLQPTDTPNLAFMASGPIPPNAADLLGTSRLLSLLSVGLEVFDLIVVDSPPVMGLADAPLLSNAVAATMFIVGAGQVRTKLIRAAVRRLHMSRASLIGTVITRFDVRHSYGYGYGYGYGHGYGYGYGYGHDAAGAKTAAAAELAEQGKLTSSQAGG